MWFLPAEKPPDNGTQNLREWHFDEHMAPFVGDLVEVAKEHITGQKDSKGGRAYIQAINNDDDNNEDENADCRGTKRPRYDVKYLIGNRLDYRCIA